MSRVQLKERMTISNAATPYACCGLFDMCSAQDLLSLSMQKADPFLDWLGWEASDVCVIKRNFINWIRPQYTNGTVTEGWLSDPCADPNGTEMGVCDFTLTDFGRVRRGGPVRDVTINDERYCELQPRYRIDGTVVNDTREWDMLQIGEVILQDLRHLIVNGNTNTGGQFDGLQRLIKTGYTNANGQSCPAMDSIVINWNSNGMNGGAGVTWNGAGVGTTYGLIDVLLAVFRNIRQRIKWSPTLAAQAMQAGDMALVLPSFLINCILDAYTCWSVCAGSQYNEVNKDSYEARNFRRTLDGGAFGNGRIWLDGIEIPLLAYDWGLVIGSNLADMYFMTVKLGGVRLVNGQYLNMQNAARAYPELSNGYGWTDGGRFLTWANSDNTCVQQIMEMRPRLLMWAPWAQARFQNVFCGTAGPILSNDPTSGYLFNMQPAYDFYGTACPA